MRCVYIFENFEVSELLRVEPEDPLKSDQNKILETLQKFNYNWKDSTYRDAFKVLEKYSPIQQEYFMTEPRLRKELIKKWLMFKSTHELVVYFKLKNIYETDIKKYLLDNFFLF
jgi:hypothetical protein